MRDVCLYEYRTQNKFWNLPQDEKNIPIGPKLSLIFKLMFDIGVRISQIVLNYAKVMNVNNNEKNQELWQNKRLALTKLRQMKD